MQSQPASNPSVSDTAWGRSARAALAVRAAFLRASAGPGAAPPAPVHSLLALSAAQLSHFAKVPRPAALAAVDTRGGIRSFMSRHGINDGVLAALLHARPRLVTRWLSGESDFKQALVAFAEKWQQSLLDRESGARAAALAAVAHLSPHEQETYVATVGRQAAETLARSCSQEALPLALSDIPPESVLRRVYEAELRAAAAAAAAGATAASSATPLIAAPSPPPTVPYIHVHILAPDAAALRRMRGDFLKLEASAAALLAEDRQLSQWLELRGDSSGSSSSASPAPTAGAAAAAVAAAVVPVGGPVGVDRWGQLHFSDGAVLEWAPLSESAVLRGLDAALARRWLVVQPSPLAVASPQVASPQANDPAHLLPRRGGGLVDALELGVPGAADIAEHLSGVVESLRARFSNNSGGATRGSAAPHSVSAASAIAKVAAALAELGSARVAESSGAVVSHALLQHGSSWSNSTVAVIAREQGAALPPGSLRPAPLAPTACRLYAPGSERGLMLFGATADAAKAALRTGLDAATAATGGAQPSSRGQGGGSSGGAKGGSDDLPSVDWGLLLGISWAVAEAFVEGAPAAAAAGSGATPPAPLWRHSRCFALDCLLLVLDAWEVCLQRTLGRLAQVTASAENDMYALLEQQQQQAAEREGSSGGNAREGGSAAPGASFHGIAAPGASFQKMRSAAAAAPGIQVHAAAPPPPPLAVDRVVTQLASRVRAAGAAMDALLQLQAVAWYLAPALCEEGAAHAYAPLDVFSAGDVLASLAVVLAMGPAPLRLLGPAAARVSSGLGSSEPSAAAGTNAAAGAGVGRE